MFEITVNKITATRTEKSTPTPPMLGRGTICRSGRNRGSVICARTRFVVAKPPDDDVVGNQLRRAEMINTQM